MVTQLWKYGERTVVSISGLTDAMSVDTTALVRWNCCAVEIVYRILYCVTICRDSTNKITLTILRLFLNAQVRCRQAPTSLLQWFYMRFSLSYTWMWESSYHEMRITAFCARYMWRFVVDNYDIRSLYFPTYIILVVCLHLKRWFFRSETVWNRCLFIWIMLSINYCTSAPKTCNGVPHDVLWSI